MNYFSILYVVIFLSVLLLGIWIYSEKNLKGKYNKLINYLSFPLALLGLYSVFRLNIDFSYVLVSLIIASLFLWILGKSISLKKLAKESRSFFIILSLITIFRSFIFEPFQIPSESMIPGLEIGDFVLVNKYEYGLKNPIGNQTLISNKSPDRGDVIVFTPPHTKCNSEIIKSYPKDSLQTISRDIEKSWGELKKSCSSLGLKYVKRVIGIPGDVLEIKGKDFLVNGIKVVKSILNSNSRETFYEESFGKENYLIRQSKLRELSFYQSWKIPEGFYFVMGDNRDNSLDSRSWGLVPENNITGKAQLIWLSWSSYGSFPSFGRNKIIK